MMSKEEILEYNKLCAKFLGMENDAFLLDKQIEKNTQICHLNFHTDWNMIVSMVEAIEARGYDVFINGLYCRITDSGMSDFEIESDKVENKKEAVVKVIYGFLK